MARSTLRPRRNLVLTAGVWLLWVGGVAAGGAKYTFKIATLAPENSVFMVGFRQLAKDVRETTGGQVRFTFYPGGVQGDERTVVRKMRIGQVHGGAFLGMGMALICPEAVTLQLPMVFDTEAEFDHVLRALEPGLEREGRTRGYRILGWPHVGFVYLFSKDRVHDLDSLRQAKPWQVQDDLISKTLFEEADIGGVGAHVSDVLTGLQSGLLRSIFSPPVGAVSMQWSSRVNYRLDLSISYAFGVLAVNEKAWARLPPSLQQQLRRLCNDHLAALNRNVTTQNDEALAVMNTYGVKTVTPTAADRTAFREVSAGIRRRLTGQAFSAAAWKRLQTAIAAARGPK